MWARVLGILLLLAFLLPSRTPSCSLSLPNSTAIEGALTIIPVQIQSSSHDVTGVQFDLEYNKQVLEIGVLTGSAAALVRRNPYIAELPAGKRILIIDPTRKPLSDGPLVNLFVRVKPDAEADIYPISLTHLACTNADGNAGEPMAASGIIFVDRSQQPQRVLQTEGIVNAASYLPGPISPGEIITILGDRLATSSIRVQFDDAAGVVLYASANQINVVVPTAISGKTSVRLSLVDDGGGITASAIVPVSNAAPGVFTVDGSGIGQAVVFNEDLTPNGNGNPARRNSGVTAWVTGMPLIAAQSLTVTVGGWAAEVAAISQVPNTPGILQVSFKVPPLPDSARNPVPLTIQAARVASQDGVTLVVR